MYEEKALKIIDDVNIFKNSNISKKFNAKFFYGGGYVDIGKEILLYNKTGNSPYTYEDGKYYFTIGNGVLFNGYLYWTYNPEYENVSSERVSLYKYYVEGRAIGIEVEFYRNGNLKEIRNTILSGDCIGTEYKYHGIHFKWYANGNLKQEGYYMTHANTYHSAPANYAYNAAQVLYRKYDINGKILASKTELTQEEKEIRDRDEEVLPFRVIGLNTFYDYFKKDDREPDTNGYFKRGLDIAKKLDTPYIEMVNMALSAGTDVRKHIPDYMPENMNPLNGVRKPLILD